VNYKDFFASGGFSVSQTNHHSVITGLYKQFKKKFKPTCNCWWR